MSARAQGAGYEQLEMAELEAEIAELQTELHQDGGGQRPPSATTQPPSAGLERSMQEQIARLERQVAQLTPRAVRRDSELNFDSSPVSDAVSRRELDEALAEKERHKTEVAILRQAFTSVPLVADDEQKLQQLLASVGDSLLVADDDADRSHASGPPRVPDRRALRQTAPTQSLLSGLYFTHDAQTVVHGDNGSNELSLWDLQDGTRTVGLQRSGTILHSALSPDSSLLCVAAKDGLGIYRFSSRGIGGEPPSCEPLWEAGSGEAFCDATFSCDSTMVASVRAETGIVEIRDVKSNNTLNAIEDFPACFVGDRSDCLSFSRELLAVGGRSGKPNSRQVRLYSIASAFEEHKTLQLPLEYRFLIFNHAGTKLAVGTRDPADVFVYSSENDWSDPPIRLGTIPAGQLGTTAMTFSQDDRLLCTGYQTSDPNPSFNLWDVDAGICVRVLQMDQGAHMSCSFSPADDLLALGGSSAPVTLHDLRPSKPLGSFALPGGQEAPLSATLASEEVVVLASGTRLAAVRRSDDKVIFQMDVKEEIRAGHFPMALQPDGEQVAVCMASSKTVLLHNLHTGKELHLSKVFEGDLLGVNYSVDGSLLMVYGGWNHNACVKVYQAGTGKQLHHFETNGGGINHAVVDPSGKLLATTGGENDASVRDLMSGEIVHKLEDSCHTQGLCFDDKGERLAYFRAYLAKNPGIVICDAKNGWRELRRFPVRGWDYGHCDFSPGKGEYLLVRHYSGSFVFLDANTGEEPAWGKCFWSMVLPPAGTNAGAHNQIAKVNWVRPSQPAAIAENDGDDDPPLILRAAVDKHLYIVDVSAFIRSFEKDGNFSLDQLNRLSDHAPESIPMLLEKWPYTINYRDDETGDTVLHHCARSGNPNAAKLWLAGTVPYTPLENNHGRSPLREAIENQQDKIAKQLVGLLDHSLDLQRTGSLTTDLLVIANKWPRQLVDFIELMEERSILFRKLKTLDVLNTHLEDFDARASVDGRGTQLWDSSHRVQYEGGEREVKCDATLQVLALSGFAMAPTKDDSNPVVLPPYTQLFNAVSGNDERLSALLETKLMRVATKFKWETYVRYRVQRRLGLYLAHFILAATTLLVSTQTTEQNADFHSNGGWTGEWSTVTLGMAADILMVCLLVTNTLVLYREVRQLQLTVSIKEYLSDGWNFCDLGGIITLYMACFGHFAQSTFVLTQVGAFGVLLNAFSVLQLLTPFKMTGPLIKTVIEIMLDIRGYLIIIIILLLGFSVSFAVSMPDNEAFISTSGPLAGLLTTFQAILGDFHMSNYENALSTASFLFFLFLNVVVMLNLLIAIMSDSYEKVKDGEVVEALKLRAETIINEEATMSEADWCNSSYFPEYLEVLQATEPPEIVWSGVSGQISKLDAKVNRMVGEMEQVIKAEVNKKVSVVEGKVDTLQKEQQEINAKLEAILKAVTTGNALHGEPEQEVEP